MGQTHQGLRCQLDDRHCPVWRVIVGSDSTDRQAWRVPLQQQCRNDAVHCSVIVFLQRLDAGAQLVSR